MSKGLDSGLEQFYMRLRSAELLKEVIFFLEQTDASETRFARTDAFIRLKKNLTS